MGLRHLALTALLGLTAGSCNKEPPAAAEQQRGRRAVGSVDGLSPSLARALDPADDFRPLGTAQPGDWLFTHTGEGQTFAQYLANEPNDAHGDRDTIYIQPLGETPETPSLAELKDYAERFFFGMNVVVLPSADLTGDFGNHKRVHAGHEQLLTTTVLDLLERDLPKDAYCLIALTQTDLYAGEDWNFVFGQARTHGRVGVFSFARNDRTFHDDTLPPSPPSVLRRRAIEVMTHEIGHMFGMWHCTHWYCNMNGSNSLAESDSQPAHLCPLCLRKLQHTVGFDPAARYEALRGYYDRVEMTDEADFARRRLKLMTQAPAPSE